MALYIEINCLCVLMLVWILMKSATNSDKQFLFVIFTRLTYATLLEVLLDGAWAILDGRSGLGAYIALNIINVLYMMGSGVITFLWFEYACRGIIPFKTKLHPKLSWSILQVPLLILFEMSIVSPWSGTLFYIDKATNLYHRGSLHFMQQIIAYGYFVCAIIIYAIQRIKNFRSYIKPLQEIRLQFLAIPAVGSVAGIFCTNLPLYWPSVTVALFMVYAEIQINQISIDALTGLNNRQRFDSYLNSVTGTGYKKEKKLFLYILDICGLKKINDSYGRTEGDSLLKEFAEILKKTCSDSNIFIARCGGNEFAVLYHCSKENDPQEIGGRIRLKIDERNEESKKPYELQVNLGCTEYRPGDSVSSFLKKADDLLSKNKKILSQLA